MKLAIVGSRTYPDLAQVRDFVATLPPDTVVVSGGAKGVDKAAEYAARARGLAFTLFLPAFEEHGTTYSAQDYGKRNSEIVAYCDALVAFPYGDAKGSTDTISKALRARRRVVTFEPGEVATWDVLAARWGLKVGDGD